ncbi:MAG: carboxypeptidase-like regulatory domain-containing protein [Saprospiraceae bacterium]|nr:carboxypeptidase-like regulatory domain-containing protein [Saprospiraceae bacterium]
MKMLLRLLIFPLFWLPLLLHSQSQTIRGQVLDQQSESPLIGATIQLLVETDAPPVGAMTDADGRFVLRNVPVGRQVLQLSYLGYEPMQVPNILVTAGKEVQLNLRMQEAFAALGEVVINGRADKDKPVNELATISARQFDTEQVLRYSGGRNDVAKMVANFAGVAANNDARNDIIIRGNSPTGVLWRLEGIPIPNPNHYSTLGTTGGPVSALNPNLIATSDFLTGAFPAEYGNAMAGVFDIALRTGNKDRPEFTAQLGAFSGIEALAEGPLNRKNNGSYVVAFRNSFTELASAVGLNFGTQATPKYRDLSFNVDFGNAKAGKFSFFGIGGWSTIDFLAAELDTTDLFANPNENAYNTSKFGVLGLKHNLLLNDHAYVRSIASVSYSGNTYQSDDLLIDDGQPFRTNDVQDDAVTYRLSSFYNTKINKRLTLRAGALAQIFTLDTRYDTRFSTPDFDGDGKPDWWTQRDFDGAFSLLEAYGQAQYRLSERLTLNAGLHGLYFDQIDELALEPRGAVNWQFAPKNTLSLGYGMHHQNQPLPVFLYREQLPDGSSIPTNKDLGFTRSQHLVLGYDLKPGANWRIKAEAYYQWLDDVPVDATPSSFSMLNSGADFIFPERGSLLNTGTGTNYGFELTIEKFFSRGWYGLFSLSLFEARYQGSDGVERSTAFNGQYVANALAGREFALGSTGRRFFTLDTKLTAAGGRPYTPVNLEASRAAGKEVLYEGQAFSQRLDPYFRWDVKLGMRVNSRHRKLSQTFFLDFQNVTNHRNIFAMRYNTVRQEIGRVDQIGFFPDILYRVEF